MRLIAGICPQVFLGKLAVRMDFERFVAEPACRFPERQQTVFFVLIPVPWIADLGAPHSIVEPADLAIDLAIVQTCPET